MRQHRPQRRHRRGRPRSGGAAVGQELRERGAGDHIDPQAFMSLDLSDFDRAFDLMRRAILSNQWEQRLDAIRQEKERVLERFQFFPMLERILRDKLRVVGS